MDAVLAWPVVECEACGFNLRETTVKAAERSNVNGRPNWTDFCPRCGHGYVVSERVLPVPPAEVLAEREAQAILKDNATGQGLEKFDPEHLITPGVVSVGEVSGVPPDKRGEQLAENLDPEGQLSQEPQEESQQPEGAPEPDAIKAPGEGQFFCTKCAANHNLTSDIGKRHSKHREA